MKNTWFQISVIVLVMTMIAGCAANSEKKRLKTEVEEMEKILYSDTTGIPDRTMALQAIQAYENYANALPEDTLSAEYLFKGAELAMSQQMAGKAIEYHNRIINNYPDYGKVSYSLFLQAFIYENLMQQFETAKKLYTEFIDKYPEHALVDDAIVSVKNMGKSIEELIEGWETQEQK